MRTTKADRPVPSPFGDLVDLSDCTRIIDPWEIVSPDSPYMLSEYEVDFETDKREAVTRAVELD